VKLFLKFFYLDFVVAYVCVCMRSSINLTNRMMVAKAKKGSC
jgi:hypothetical protein